MTNLVIFIITLFMAIPIHFRFRVVFQDPGSYPIKKLFKEWALIAVLFLPLNINGNVFTVFGSGVSDKSFYSVFSVYQEAEGDAVAVLGSLDQEAGRDAESFVGLVGYQKAGRNALLIIGISGYQKADNFTLNAFGVNVFQNGETNTVVLGFSGYQKSHGDNRGEGNLVMIGLVGYQKGINNGLGIGIGGFQNSSQRALTLIGLTFYQKAGPQNRSFAVFSDLIVPPKKVAQK